MARKPDPNGAKVLRPVRPNEGIRADYRRRLTKLVGAMTDEVLREICQQYDDRPPPTLAPGLAEDAANPISALSALVKRMRARWEKRFAELAPRLAQWHAVAVSRRSDAALRTMLREGGVTVRMQTSPSQQAAMQASVGENVGLIKTIPEAYFGQIEAAVMRSAAQGFDLHALQQSIERLNKVPKHRAALIARDQSSKMTAVFTRERMAGLGIRRATWRHSGGGHEPRPDHVAADGTVFEIDKGLYLSDLGKTKRWQIPGTSLNCRCVMSAVLEIGPA